MKDNKEQEKIKEVILTSRLTISPFVFLLMVLGNEPVWLAIITSLVTWVSIPYWTRAYWRTSDKNKKK